MENETKNNVKPKSKLRVLLSTVGMIIALPFLWPYIWFFKWRKSNNVKRAELTKSILSETRSFKKFPMKIELFFLKLMFIIGMTGIIWWPPTFFAYRATLHPIVLFITVKTPLVFVGATTLILLFRFVKSRTTPGGRVLSFFTTVGAIALIVFYGSPVYEYFSILWNYNHRMKAFELQELPLTANEKVHAKYTIHGVADHEATDDTKDATVPHYVRLNDSSWYWSSEIEASKTKWQQFLFDHPREVFFTRGDQVSPKFDLKHNETEKVKFVFGEFLWLSSNSHTATTKKLDFWQYFRYEPVDYIILLQDTTGAWVQVIPIIKWEGIFFPLPTFGGVMINRQGNIPWLERVFFGGGEFIPQTEVNKYSFLKGQSLVPVEVSLYIAKTFRVFYSWKAPLPGNHEGDIRIPDMPNQFTKFPFQEYFKMSEVVPDSLKNIAYDGVYQYIPLEPYGEDKHLLSFSLFIRGDDAMHLFYYDHKTRGEKLLGPTAIPAKITDYNPSYDWNKAVATEETPVIRDVFGERHFFWKTNIQTTQGDSASREITFGKAEIALIDGAERQVYIHLNGEQTRPMYWQAEMEKALLPYARTEDTLKLVLPTTK